MNIVSVWLIHACSPSATVVKVAALTAPGAFEHSEPAEPTILITPADIDSEGLAGCEIKSFITEMVINELAVSGHEQHSCISC